MAALPLTHHELLELVAPFSRGGRHLDLARTDRLERRLVFQPVECPASTVAGASLQEHLELEVLPTGTCRLTRTLTQRGGLQATLTAMGAKPAELFARVQALAPGGQFTAGDGFRIARSYDLGYGAATGVVPGRMLTRGTAELGGLRIHLNLSPVRGVPAEITLETLPGAGRLELPEDLLAVLGWDWVGLIRTPGGYKSKLRLRGGAERRTGRAEAALETAARHLVRTLALPPSNFHQRWAWARWGVVFRRSIPVLTLLTLIGTIAALPHFVVEGNPGLWLLMFHVPTALIALSFCLQEQAQYEIPPPPRRLTAGSWYR
jgi:hypothetical protein